MGRELPVLVGREAEVGVLRSAWGDTEAGVPVVVLVGGEAGIGKTALLNLFAAGLGDGVLVLRGQCVNLGGQGLAYAPLVGVLSDLVRQVGRESVIRLAGAWRADLARLVPDLGPAATEAEAGRSRLFQGVVSLLEQAASRHPVVLVVEDLHWADESTLELLRFAVRTLRDGRLMLAGSYRSDELTRRHPLTPVLADLVTADRVSQLLVPRLGAEETAGLVRRRLDTPVDAALVDSLVARSEGVPFFAEELARSAAQGVKGLPGTLAEVLSARLGELTEDARQVMEAAAVGGANISETDVAAVLDVPGDRVDAALREGIDRQILTVTQGSAEFGFRHALLRGAVMDSLLPGRLATLHRRWARHLAATPAAQTDAGRAVRVAQHWHAAHDTDHAFAASLTAAHLLRSAAAPDEELRMLEQALSLWDAAPEAQASPHPDRAAVHQEAAEAALAAGEPQRSLHHYASALEELDSTQDPVRFATVLLHRTLVTDSPTLAGESEIEKALRLLPASDPDSDVGRLRALGLVLRARARVIIGDYAGTESLAREAIAYSRQSGNRRAESHAMSLLANAFDAVGRSEEALALRYERMPLLDGVEDPRERAGARINLVGTLMQLRRLREALDIATDGVTLSKELGVYRSEGAIYAGMVAECLFELGRWDDAAALCSETLDARPASEAALELTCLAATMAILRGDRSADDEVQRMQESRARVDDPWFIWRLATVRALAALEHEDTAAALAVLGKAIKDPDAVAHPSLAGPLLHTAARALAPSAHSVDGPAGDLTVGDVTERLDALPPGVDMPVWRALSSAELAAQAHQVQKWSTSIALLEEGLEGFAYERAWALYRLGQAQIAAGAPDATSTLRSAQAQAEHLRALPLLRRIVEVTRAGQNHAPTGGVSRRPNPGNPFGLTGREHEVLSLVSAGLSNGDIAKRLFISPKTVSVHISNILGKLGVTNRGQAAEKARQLGLLTRDHDASTEGAVVGPVGEGP